MAKDKETMKFKYVGLYAPTSNWVEHLYHESVEIKGGVAETSSKTTAEALRQLEFIPYDQWEKEEAKRQEEARAADEARREEMLAKAERIKKNAEKTAEAAEKRTPKQQKELDEKAAAAGGEKPLLPIEEQESSVSMQPASEDAEGKE